MTDTPDLPPAPTRLHWAHWAVLAASLLLTLTAWLVSRHQTQARLQALFDHDATQVVGLIAERMQKYESGLWAGVGVLSAVGADHPLTRSQWIRFTDAIDLPNRYPGINGIGLIDRIATEGLSAYKARMQKEYPELDYFEVHPEKVPGDHLVISYIEPFANNREAIGLDTAFETNRREAALKALETGQAQVTGPITLVQDEGQTPGFLFHAPFQLTTSSGSQRSGTVYAAFVVRKLMEGTLSFENRRVSVSVRDGETYLFEENTANTPGFDASPLFKREVTLPLYGRNWLFEIQTNDRFAAASASRVPNMVLIGGLTVDALLLGIFILLASSNARAHYFAQKMTRNLQRSKEEITRRNEELIQFNYRVSHDLVGPIKTIEGLADCATADLEDGNTADLSEALTRISRMARQQSRVVGGIFDLCQADLLPQAEEQIELRPLVLQMFERACAAHPTRHVRLEIDVADGLTVQAPTNRLSQILLNVIGNSIKFSRSDDPDAVVTVRAWIDDGCAHMEVRDNGVGIPASARDRIFELFFRGQSTETGGAGLGLYIVHRNIEQMNGKVALRESPDGTTLAFSWPQHPIAESDKA